MTLLARLGVGITLLVVVFALRARPESVAPRTLPFPAPRSSEGAAWGPASSTASSDKGLAEDEKSLPEETKESTRHPLRIAHDPKGTPALVRQVIDGDTILLDDGQVVRYIGIDAPEMDKRGKRECFARESTAKNRTLVEGKRVRLEKDISERDTYRRILRYVYVGDVFVNEVLIREGVARAFAFPPDVAFKALFRSAERDAREAKRGLWSSACAERVPFDDRDCEDFQSRADAQRFFLNEGSVERDPHKLDQDGDGIACESLR